ncbi:cryptochrome/deoxyribodipyrimidine photo-lyase family protein [Aquimarina brevivitae]|uniref:Deoxyribodipyrimidine photo-lyase family protein (Cryptochrome) n=1 Tax=Aquimarina brevivitae TaxID=323412 RepID=A0A4V2F7H6_9FLAO|nr:FAD-binding domain-containing protein [Aquimarina brevivitae]RZS99849.1 deoxyribodipyrimidine photo-lyase family protein (cryptochrome) [Aquimarina brevivitae]
MNTKKETVNIVWFKRDLRLQDNEAIYNAAKASRPTLLLYVFEHSLIEDKHYSERHWNFIKQSIVDLNNQLAPYNTKVLSVASEIIPVISTLQQFWKIESVFSHQETGIRLTYDRDKAFSRFCKNNLIQWKENINNGVFRGIENRETWREDWESYMIAPIFDFTSVSHNFMSMETIAELEKIFQPVDLHTHNNTSFQPGGTTKGLHYLESFFAERYVNYNAHISKPLEARTGCSRLSPYLAWGNLSVRQVIHYALEKRKTSSNKKQIDAFMSRLKWQAHFIQKFEMEDVMEFESINKGYRKLKKQIAEAYQIAWKEGKTGYPLVDACMRCLKETGYLNFRMRALVVSFFTHNLWQPWQAATAHLSQMFLDFEPGIHFPQLQMQAGETGINTLRIYNPVKNSVAHDPKGEFIKKWIPELSDIPENFIHEPYLMTPMEQKMYDFTLGEDYPLPIVDIQKTRKKASDTLWELRKDPLVQKESFRILKKHTLPDRDNLN